MEGFTIYGTIGCCRFFYSFLLITLGLIDYRYCHTSARDEIELQLKKKC